MHYSMRTHGRVEVQTHKFLTSNYSEVVSFTTSVPTGEGAEVAPELV
jgi:hypothetical protein